MYFIEKIIKLYLSFKNTKKQPAALDYGDNYVLEDVLSCSHHFLPLDSSKEYFACSKCGYTVKKDRLRKKRNKNAQ